MIHILDLNAYGNFHVLFNVSMLKVLMNVYPEKKMTFYCQQTHWDAIRSFFTFDELTYKISHSPAPVKTQREISGVSIPKIVLRETLFFRKILKLASQKNDDLIFLCSVHSISFVAFKYVKRFFPKPLVIATLHGEIEFLFQANTNWERRTASLFQLLFKGDAPRFVYLLLNKISKTRLIENGYLNEINTIEIDHPFIYTPIPHLKYSLNERILIGQVGSMGLRKNAHLLYDLANFNEKEIQENKLSFWTIGPIEEDVTPFKTSLVHDLLTTTVSKPHQDGYIPREIYEAKVKEIDYAVFFYGPNQFIFRASGAIQDVINYVKPLIVLRHPYFEYLFKQAGNIGFICDTLHDMAKLLERISNKDEDLIRLYKEQCENLELYKEKNNISYIARDFKDQIQIFQK